jgi:hypothetical protein
MTKHEKEHKPSHLVESQAHYGDDNAIMAYLAEKAAEGWRLVSVVGDRYFFEASQ